VHVSRTVCGALGIATGHRPVVDQAAGVNSHGRHADGDNAADTNAAADRNAGADTGRAHARANTNGGLDSHAELADFEPHLAAVARREPACRCDTGRRLRERLDGTGGRLR
jgi:hypothetical protein